MMRVAIQGVKGSYSDEAARQLFGDDVAIIECGSFDETFAAVRLGTAKNAVVPVKNKIVGEIREPMDLLNASSFQVIDRLALKVQHVLVGAADATLEDLVSVRSHIEALKQCRRFL